MSDLLKQGREGFQKTQAIMGAFSDSYHHYRMAKVHYDKADLLAAEEHFLSSLDLWNIPEEASFKFKVLGFLIRIASEKGDDRRSEQYTHMAEELLSLAHPDKSRALMDPEYLYNDGVIQNYRGNFQKARELFALAYQLSSQRTQVEDLELRAKCLYSMAFTGHHLKEYNQALGYLSELSPLLERLNKFYMKGTMHLLYGNIYFAMGSDKEALLHLAAARSTLLTKTCWNLTGHIMFHEGMVYKRMGQWSQALFYFEFALNAIDPHVSLRLANLITEQINEINDNNVDLVLDKGNRLVIEKRLGIIDFKHRFILMEILFLLASDPGVYYDKEQMAKAIWKDEYNPLIHDKLVYTSVSRLRKLIEPKNNKRKYIIRGKDGYALSTTVKIRFHRPGALDKAVTHSSIDLSSPV